MQGKQCVPIREDNIIRAIRRIKKAVGIAKMNELCVCDADLKTHAGRRKSFETSMIFAAAFAGLVLLFIIGSAVFGRFDSWAFVSAVALCLLLLALPLFRYSPALDMPKSQVDELLKKAPKSSPQQPAQQLLQQNPAPAQAVQPKPKRKKDTNKDTKNER